MIYGKDGAWELDSDSNNSNTPTCRSEPTWTAIGVRPRCGEGVPWREEPRRARRREPALALQEQAWEGGAR